LRFDEINFIGDFSVNGLTGNEGQFIGLSGSLLSWLDPVPSSQGFSLYGDNYVYCNSVTYSATASAQNLFAAYASASNLSVSSTNRGAVLISPGTYDFDNIPLGLSLSYIDLVGVSPAASSVILKASNAPYTLKYYEGVDTGLYNVGLTGGTSLAILGSASTFLRWNNINLLGEAFRNESNLFAFENLQGEFKNVNLINGSNFAVAKGNITAIFDNIKSDNLGYFLQAQDGNIIATVSNVEFISNGGVFFSAPSGSIKGTYRNIIINEVDNMFVGLTISGNFENIRIKNIYSDFFYGHIYQSNVQNIKLEGTTARAFAWDIDSVFDRIQIEYLSYNAFGDLLGSGSIKGTFSNIVIDFAPEAFVAKSIQGNFSNIKIKDSYNGSVFKSLAGDISGTFSNISIDKSDSGLIDFFSSTGNLDINAYDINISRLSNIPSGYIFYGAAVTGNYSDIVIGTGGIGLEIFRSVNQIKGGFNNILVGDIYTFFKAGQNDSSNQFTGSFSNITSGDVTEFAFFNGGDNGIVGHFKDIKLGNILDGFRSVGFGNVDGKFENISVGNCRNIFEVENGDLTGNFKNISVGESESAFKAVNILANMDDIQILKIQKLSFNGSTDFDGVLNNIIIENLVDDDNSNNYFNCNGTVSNIYCTNITQTNAKFFSRSDIQGSYENIYIGSISRIFEASNSYSWNTKIKNLNAKGPFGGGASFTASITNSIVDAFGIDHAIKVGDGCKIDRCRFIADSNSGDYSIHSGGSSVNCNITFTLTNAGIENTITNNIIDNKNIDSTYIRREGKF
jgi:hypothetical protein